MSSIQPKHWKLAVALVGVLSMESAWACMSPVAPRSIPDGRRAEAVQMLEARREIDQYLQHVYLYMECEADGRKLQAVKAEQKLVTDNFNAQIRAFNARSEAQGFRRVSLD
jgi:hypothetical protein